MFLYKYKNYDEYINAQMVANRKKHNSQWAKYDEICFLSKYLIDNFISINFGICHGTRQGNEQKWFSEFTKAHVIGTEIGENAEEYFNTIKWDFNKIKNEWINNVDFIYSNAFDHTIDPEKCLKLWMECVKNTGCCILEWTTAHNIKNANITDPFGASFEEYKHLVDVCKFKIKDELNYKSIESKHEKFYIVIVK